MARWIASPLGAVNLDTLVQLGTEMGLRSATGQATWDVIGWSATGDRFAVQDGFPLRIDAETWLRQVTAAST